MPPGILLLPLELLRVTIQFLDLDDYCNLIQASKALETTLSSESTCKDVVRRCIPQSQEAQLARLERSSYQEAVARTFRRRNAYRAARPFSALVLGEGSQMMYRDGIVAYVRDQVVHIVNIRGTSAVESAIDLCLALGISRSGGHQFKLLHFQDNVLSVFRTSRSSNSEAHLIVFDARPEVIAAGGRILFEKRLSIGQKNFVRHDSKHLVYGTYMGTEDSEDEVWGFQLFELATNRRGSKPFHPGSFTTPDIGSNIVFEIHDGYFYAVTSQITVDCEGQDPSSYYGGCRYPLSGSAEEAEFWRIWRRQQREGPIHDLWTDLTLRKDENSHNLVLSETRREWQDGFRKQKRTFYTEPLDLTAISNFNVSYREYVKLKQAAAGSLPTDKAEDEDFSVEILLSEVPDVLLPELSLPHRRSARHCQPEFYGSLVPGSSEFGLTSIKYRSYNYSNSAFLDIVVDSQSPTWCPGRRNCLRLRIGSRVLTSPVGTDGLLQRLDGQSDNEPRVDDESYGDSSIRLWPPLDAPAEIYDLLHNTSNLSKLNATSDERSLVYMATTDDPTCIAPIVLINFDPAIRFPGLKKVRFGEDIGSWSAKANEAALRRHELAHVRRDSPHEAATTAGESHSQRPWARMQKAEWQQRCYGFEFG